MRPIGIIQHEDGVSAGHFESWLQARSLPFELIGIHRGDPVPVSAAGYSALCSLGGSMSVNDPLAWIDAERALLADAVARGVAVIGHCLGGQLLASALGARVSRNRVKEMGWLPVVVEDSVRVQAWFGTTDLGELFHWHGDAFEVPASARRMLSSPLSPNQAFVAQRAGVSHVGMQFHIEMTPELVLAWSRDPAAAREVDAERRQTGGPGVQSPNEMQRDLERRCGQMKDLAWRLYDRWAEGLRR